MIDSMELGNEIRRAVLGHQGQYIRQLLLNREQILLVKEIEKNGTLRASLLAHNKGISIQNASAKLNRLFTAGYLDRIETSAPSGGIEYFYTIAENND
jgi:predicted transcriptional regulator